MEAEVEGGDDAEIAAAAADAPEEVGVLVLAGHDLAPVGGHDLGGDEIVADEAALALEPATAAAGDEPAETGAPHAPARDGEAMLLRRGVELGPVGAAPGAHGLRLRVDLDRAEAAEVDADAAVHDRRAGDAVPTAVYGERQVLLAREVDRGDDVVGRGAARDHRG